MSALTIPVFPAQLAVVAAYLLANPTEARAYGLAPAEAGAPLPDSPDTRTYHLGAEPTPNRGYDDRLTTRTGYGRTKLRELLALGEHKGGIRHTCNGRDYWVTERALQAYYRDKP